MDMIIREAVQSDAQSIWQLNCDGMGYSYPLDSTKENLERLLQSAADKIFVAVMDGQVVGYVHANDYLLLYAPHMKNIMGIAVNMDYQHRGIGSALLRQVEQWARQTGAAGVRLVSGATRTGAHAFYHQCGYAGDKAQLNLKKMF